MNFVPIHKFIDLAPLENATKMAREAHSQITQLAKSITDYIDRLNEPVKEFNRRLSLQISSSPTKEILVVLDESLSEEERMAAIDSLLSNNFKKPIYRKRYKAIFLDIKEELQHEADKRGISIEMEVRRRAQPNLFVAITLSENEPVPEAFNCIRRKLNDLLTEDLLGINWRAYKKYRTLDEFGSKHETDYRPTTQRIFDLNRIIEKGIFTDREIQLLKGKLKGKKFKEMGELLGISEGAARTAYHRTRKKFLKANDHFGKPPI